ncbi:hypothetical protein Tco_0183301 [Tanacetum coccineum]
MLRLYNKERVDAAVKILKKGISRVSKYSVQPKQKRWNYCVHHLISLIRSSDTGVSPPQKKISKKSSSGVVATTDACENGHIACPSCCTKMKRKSRSGRDICPCPFCDIEIGSKIGSRRNRCRGLEKFIKSISTLKTSFKYQLTAKSMDTCLDMKSVPEVYTECSKLTSEKDYLTVPFEFAGYNALLSLDVCIKKISISSEFDEEVLEGSMHLKGKFWLLKMGDEYQYIGWIFTHLELLNQLDGFEASNKRKEEHWNQKRTLSFIFLEGNKPSLKHVKAKNCLNHYRSLETSIRR